MAVVSMKQLLEAGLYTLVIRLEDGTLNGENSSFTERNGIYIIDLSKTVKKVEEA